MNTTIWPACIDSTGILVIAVYRSVDTTIWSASVNGARIPVIAVCRRYIYHHRIAFLVVNHVRQYMPALCVGIEGDTIVAQEVIAVAVLASIRILINKNARSLLCGQHHEI